MPAFLFSLMVFSSSLSPTCDVHMLLVLLLSQLLKGEGSLTGNTSQQVSKSESGVEGQRSRSHTKAGTENDRTGAYTT